MSHLTDLVTLTSAIKDLDMVQSWIDHARVAAPTNQHVQQQLDLRQAEVDAKRIRIQAAMTYISSQN